MSRARTRSVAGASNGENGSSTRASLTKATDDSLTRNVRPNHESKTSRSRNKIPKNMRNDLENSLVGLCNVWFEEIKPHLVRNNIKLHVHGDDASANAGCASGDYVQQSPGPTTPGCSHLDPGAALDPLQQKSASYVVSSSTQPTVSKAPCHKQQAPTRRPDHQAQIQRPNCEVKRVQRSYTVITRRKKRISQLQSSSNWRVPRLCRTHSVIPSESTKPTPRPFDDTYIRELFKSVYNKAPLVRSRHRCTVTTKNRSTQTGSLIDTVEMVAVQPRSPDGRMHSPASRSSRQRVETAMSSPIHHQTYHKSYRNQPITNEPVLFENDLIDIIGQKHDERLQIIYNSPEQVKYPSLMNLVSPNNRQRKASGPKKLPPWR